MDFVNNLNPETIIIIAILIFSIIIHEMAHGYAALFLGDDTAERAGRLTLNPIPHLDPIGSVLLPAFFILTSSPFFFGYAKPVPYNPSNISDKKWGNAKVAAAGPISNFILALFFVLIMGFLIATNQGSEATYNILKTAAFMNIFLAVLNLLPIPPLDGSKVFLDILKNYSSRLFIQISRLFNKYQFIIFFVLLLFIFYTNFLIIVSQWIFTFYESLLFWL
jgi:Zn-dependent protease